MAYTFKHGDRPIEGITVQRAVGRGGFGEVYYALADSGKQVALKYLRDNPEIELRGIGHVMNLKSPYLITIYDVRQNDQGEPFVIMEYVSGPSLRDLLIVEPDGLGPQKAAFFLNGIAKGLNYLHERGIVHRDLKPGNIFYDDGYVKIGDYGLSKHIAISAHSANTISVGTVHYMAPEIGSGSYSKSIDIYALGVMLYEMLTGRLPFTGSSMGEVLMRHLRDQPDCSGIAEPFASVIAKALAKDPSERYQDVDEMAEALTSVTEVSESLASFDASVLTQTPRGEDAAGADRTRTTPPEAVPAIVLDAREEAEEDLGLPPIPPIPPVLDRKRARKARRLERKARRLQSKAQRKAQAVQAKLADLGVGPAARRGIDQAMPVARKRWQQAIIAFIVLFAASGGLGIGYGTPVVFGASLLYLLGGLIGTLLGYKLNVRRQSLEYNFHDRLLYTACGFVFMLPAFAAGHAVYPGAFHRLIIPLTATLLVFNWTERIRLGRRQIIQGGTIFWHGFLAAIFAAMADADGLAAAILAAVLLILVQTLVGIWPLPLPTAAPRPGPQLKKIPARGAWERVEGAYRRVATAVEGVSERIEKAGEHVEREVGRHRARPTEDAIAPPAEPDEPRKKEVAAEQQLAQPAQAEVGYQPSFVGRTANAGLSFLAKLLLLAGLTVAFLFSAELVNIDWEGNQVLIGARRILIAEGGHRVVDGRIPPAAVFAPLLLGSILLIVARRHDGAAHFVRGFFGCVLACIAATLAVGPFAEEMAVFFGGNWDALKSEAHSEALFTVGILLLVSLLLLFWPKAVRRGEKPIVI